MNKPSDPSKPSPLLRVLAPWLIAAVLVGAGCALLRFELIEPLAWATACDSQRWHGWCLLRSTTIELFTNQRIGWFAAASAVLGLITGIRLFAGLALLSGAAALMLYAVEPGAFGALLGLLTLVRPAGGSASRGQTATSPMQPANTEKPSA